MRGTIGLRRHAIMISWSYTTSCDLPPIFMHAEVAKNVNRAPGSTNILLAGGSQEEGDFCGVLTLSLRCLVVLCQLQDSNHRACRGANIDLAEGRA
jgi:hypothetical protein